MKKIKIFGLASTLILAGAAGFTSCSSDSADPIGGGTGVAGQVVKTQFAINIPYGGNGSSSNLSHKSTRMTDAITQQSGKPFRGISNIVLLTFNGDPETKLTINASSPINIGEDGNAYDKDDYRRLYRDIQIPIGTTHMIFYGTASRNSESEFQAGKITEKGSKASEKTLTNLSHELTPIASDAKFTLDGDAQKIIAALNDIAKANVTDGTTTYTWATIGSVTTLPSWLTDQEKVFLSKRYTEFIKLKAGSKNSVVAFIKNLKLALAGETSGATVPDGKILAKEIYDKCEAALTTIGTLDFPGKFNLPDGVATLSWTGSEFQYNTPGTELFVTGNNIDYQKICYPAELSYFVKTTTMVSDLDMSKVDNFPTYENWTKTTGADWTGKGFTESEVTNYTKTVGLKDPIQYSVAVLKSTVRCDAANLEDNAKTIGGLKEDQSITVGENTFPITGILIGGQPKSVDWKYEAPTEGTFDHTIYDKIMNGDPIYAKSETSASNSNYTLVFDNKNATKQNVLVTIELENNSGKNFYGKDGVIPNGTKFYLVGELKPDASTGTTNPNGVDRVFVQDYITTANFTIKNLKNAYNCIPDLRTSGINVGLAVDLKWEEGITFNVDL